MFGISAATIWKSGLTTAVCVAGSMAACNVLVPLMGGSFDGIGFWMSMLCPLVMAWPTSTWQFHQSEKYRRALDEIGRMHGELDLMHRSLRDAHAALEHKARTDSMTGAMMRDAFFDLMHAASISGRTGTLLLADADHFKRINDEYGHQTGDAVLTAIGKAIGLSLRSGDSWGRIGGEEFAIYLAEAPRDLASTIAETIRANVAAIAIDTEQKRIDVTVSIGGVALDREFDLNHAFNEADRLLYLAKRAGRNRVLFADEEQATAA